MLTGELLCCTPATAVFDHAAARQARSWLKHKASAQAYAQLVAETGLDLSGMRGAIRAGRGRKAAAVSFDALCAEFGTDVHGVREARAPGQMHRSMLISLHLAAPVCRKRRACNCLM